MTDNRLNEVIQGALAKVKELADTGTVIGAPIDAAAGTKIIPISKVSLGFVSGGIDYLSKHSQTDVRNFGGAGTTGLTVTPVGFLVARESGDVEFLPVTTTADTPTNIVDSVTALLERSPAIVEKFKNLFGKKKEQTAEQSDAESAQQEEISVAE